MFSTPATLVGLAGVVFLAGSFAPTSFSIASLAQSQGLLRQTLVQPAFMPAKGDRVARPLPASSRSSVSVVEVVGVSQATVILRDRNGAVLYRSDPQSGVTVFSKNTELPVITLKEETQAPAVQHPVSREEGTQLPQVQKQKRSKPVGCIGDVSPLAKAAADRNPSLCIALLDQSLS